MGTATDPNSLTGHFVRRSKRRIGPVTLVVTPNLGSREATSLLGMDGMAPQAMLPIGAC